jgi:hypothetical protein
MIPRRLRTFIGTMALVAIVIVWAFVAMVLAQGPIRLMPPLWQTVYYVVAGLGWVVPAGAVIWWIGRSDRRAADQDAR